MHCTRLPRGKKIHFASQKLTSNHRQSRLNYFKAACAETTSIRGHQASNQVFKTVYNLPRSAYSPGSIWTSSQPTRLFILSRLIHFQTHSSDVFTSLLDNTSIETNFKSISCLLFPGHTITPSRNSSPPSLFAHPRISHLAFPWAIGRRSRHWSWAVLVSTPYLTWVPRANYLTIWAFIPSSIKWGWYKPYLSAVCCQRKQMR